MKNGHRCLAQSSKQLRLVLWARRKRFIQVSECAAIAYSHIKLLCTPCPGSDTVRLTDRPTNNRIYLWLNIGNNE